MNLLFLYACTQAPPPVPTCTLDIEDTLTLQAEVDSATADAVAITNTGDLSASCTLEELVQPCADHPFDVSGTGGLTLAPGKSPHLNVVYHPEDLTSCVATLTLRCTPEGAQDSVCSNAQGANLSLGYAITLVGLPLDVDADGDGYWASEEEDSCDDEDPTVYPGAEEIEDRLDNDCDGDVDEGTALGDDDGDGQSEWSGDCDDQNSSVYAGAVESDTDASLDQDDDCDGLIDEGTEHYDDDHDGWSEEAGDCNDANENICPGCSEVPDNEVDDNCQDDVDEGSDFFDDDGDSWTNDEGDCDDYNPAVYPGAGEIADGIDNDCDGTTDEGTDHYDDDGDGYSEDAGDCNDTLAGVHPGLTETPRNFTDENCNGSLEN